jgi:hypothetical protein
MEEEEEEEEEKVKVKVQKMHYTPLRMLPL